MKATILAIGDEILNGSIIDTNSRYIAEKCTSKGIKVVNILCVSDKKDEIISALNFLKKISNIIFIMGGLGPTKDDITIETLAEFSKQELIFNFDVYEKAKIFLKKRNKTIKLGKEQFKFPKNAILLENNKGSAPGIWIEEDNLHIVSMPGVPYEMKEMFLNEVLPKIEKDNCLKPVINKYILTSGIWESIIAEKIKHIEEALPENIKIAYLPKLARVKLRITATNVLEKDVEKLVKEISVLIKKFIYSYNEKDTLEKVVGEKLKAKNKTLSTAESCTGGKIAHKITSIAGSSAYFEGGIVSYSNEVKMNSLKVKKNTLIKYGAVSKQTVEEMAKGALKAVNTDYSIAVSGIAGPDGGTIEKPVGTVWIAVANELKVVSKKYMFTPFREENIELSTVVGLTMLLNFIE